MRRVALVVAVAMLLSGCNGVLGADPGATTGTVTPAPVPTSDDPAVATTASGECSVPPPATPDLSASAKPTAVRPLGLTNGSVEGERLVGAHAAALRNVSYTLRAADQIEVRALANATAFTYRGILGLRFVQAYAVGDTLYRLEPTGEDDYRIERERYRPGARLDRQFGASLVAAAWLEDRMRWFEYTHVETFAIDETTVRVLRAEFEDPIDRRQFVIIDVESVVYVDRRGIIRRLSHKQKLRTGPDDGAIAWRNETFTVTDVGTTRLQRPEAFCTLQPEPLEPGPVTETGSGTGTKTRTP
jgi:hypothetical protein